MVKQSLHAQRTEARKEARKQAEELQARYTRLARIAPFLLIAIVVGAILSLSEERKSVLVSTFQKGGGNKIKKSKTTRQWSSRIPQQVEPFDMTQFDAIHLWHVRKAGGTTLRKFLAQVADQHNMTFFADEGICYKGPVNRKTNKTLLVTMLKDPVQRILSAYWGEGDVDPNNPHSFMDWTLKTNATAFRFIPQNSHWFIWGCSQNCMIKLFGGPHPENETHALETLQYQFEFIIQSHRLGEPEYVEWLKWILSANPTNTTLLHENKSDRKHDPALAAAAPKEGDLKFVRDMNQQDYDLLKQLIPRRADLQGLEEGIDF